MQELSSEVLTNFIVAQSQLWSQVAKNLSEQNGVEIGIPTPTVSVVPLSDLTGMTASESLFAQFGFSELPDHWQILSFRGRNQSDQVNWQALASAVMGQTPESISEEIIQAVQAFIAPVLQELAAVLTQMKGSALTLADAQVLYEPLTMPADLLQVNELIEARLEFRLGGREPAVEVSWFLSESSARFLTGGELSDSVGEETPFVSDKPVDPSPLSPSAEVYDFSSYSQEARSLEDDRSLDLLMDIPLEVSVELGRIEMLIRDVLELGAGSIIELRKAAGEPVDVLVNGCLIARGEVVVVEDNFGVRITEIPSPSERIQRLGA